MSVDVGGVRGDGAHPRRRDICTVPVLECSTVHPRSQSFRLKERNETIGNAARHASFFCFMKVRRL